jgi:hypothetical protein
MSKTSRTKAAAGALALALAGWSCRPSAEAVADGDDPLAALAAPVESARYDGPFWARQAHRETAAWKAAKVFCREHAGRELPNCRAVALVLWWEGPSPSLPALPPPPLMPPMLPPAPALHPGEPGYAAADVAALKAWEERLLARGRQAPAASEERRRTLPALSEERRRTLPAPRGERRPALPGGREERR